MKTQKINPGYRINPETHDLVKQFAKDKSEELGFYVSVNKAVELLIKSGMEKQKEDQRG